MYDFAQHSVMKKKAFAATALLLFVAATSLYELSLINSPSKKEVDETLYLPNGKALKLVSLGFENVLADLLWFNTISYFGRHFRSDQQYRWLSHMCNLVIDLDPKAAHVYQFGAVMLSWELGAPDESNALLTKAMKALPDNWLFPYLRGFNYLFFFKDPVHAKDDLLLAASKPNVHPMVANLAAKQISDLDNPAVAEETLKDLFNASADPVVREVLREKIAALERQQGR